MPEQPLSFYTDDNSLRFYLLDVGEGLMHLVIFPDNTTMLFDCNVTNDNEADILEFMANQIPYMYDEDSQTYEQPIDIFVNSHRDEDHYRGLKKVNSRFPIRSIWDSGQTGDTTGSDDYKYYMYLRRKLKEQDPDNLFVPTPTDLPIIDQDGLKIYCLAAAEEYVEGLDQRIFEAATRKPHTNSMVLMIEYGSRKMLMTGDSDWKSWRDKIVPNFNKNDFLHSNILIASHHGSRSFFTDEQANETIDPESNPDNTYVESIKLINPNVTLIPCGPYEPKHHPNKEAKILYLENTDNEQVYSTHKKGHICGFIDDTGYFTVVPSRFKRASNAPNSIGFRIKCVSIRDGVETEVENNSCISVDCALKFSIDSFGGLIEPFDKLKVTWEVSNGANSYDYTHQEIYYKDDKDTDGLLSFHRELCYVGKHLLRCRIRNTHKHLDCTQIFEVNGI